MEKTRWYKDKVFYQIWPRSFKDGNGDGMGDLWGVYEKLDYLKDLGMDGIWFSPIYPSPGADCGYDIADYMDIAPEFGGMEAFKKVLDGAHARDMKVIMDPVAGDNITARGNGNFQVQFYNKGEFQMFGTYTIDNGMYKISMKEIIRKDFALQSGSTVTFTGDPYQANLDVQAVHTVNSVSLSDLSTDASLTQSTVKVNCLMNLTGSLANPTIKFDLELPTVNEEDRELVRSATSTEEQMNTQIIYLLGIGKFYAYDYAENSNRSSSATRCLHRTYTAAAHCRRLTRQSQAQRWQARRKP